VGIVIAVILLASFMPRGEVIPIRVAAAQIATIRSVVSTNGKVEPVDNFEAHAPIGTTVKRILVKEGAHVRKGQLLVQLDDAAARSDEAKALAQLRTSESDLSAIGSGGNQEEVLTLEADLAKARTARDSAQRNLDALERLQQKGAASPGEVSAATGQLARADADLKLLEQKQKERYSKPEVAKVQSEKAQAEAALEATRDVLDQLDIRAPFDGEVYSLSLHEGAYVAPGELILQEADLSKVLVRAYVDEPDVGRLAFGQKIEVTWDALPGRVWQSAVSVIPTTVRLHGTRNVGETTCIVDNKDFKLLPNINVGITIVTAEEHNALTIPREALRQDDGNSYVFQVVDNDQLRRRDVQISTTNLTQVQVVSGLEEHQVVALTSLNTKPLRDAATVKVVR
jgi:HlyD family secretion protein